MYHVATDDEPRRVLPPPPDRKSRGVRLTSATIRSEGERLLANDSGNFSVQKLSMAAANAPLISVPPAPFAKNERKRAYDAARFYSECSLHHIAPMEADTAALDAQSRFNKWWIRAKYHEAPPHDPEASKRRRLEADVVPGTTSSESTATAVALHDSSLPSVDECIREATLSAQFAANEVATCKLEVVAELQKTGGDTKTIKFQSCLHKLQSAYASKGYDARWKTGDEGPLIMDGNWLTLSKPTFSECQGRNERGQYVYSLGRLSFDMFRPTSLICSVQGIFNTISVRSNHHHGIAKRPLICPSKLHNEMMKSKKDKPVVRKYDIVVALTIEAGQTRRGTRPGGDSSEEGGEYVLRRPIRALLTNKGYCVPDPSTPNRLTIWFSRGLLEVQDDADLPEFKHLFDERLVPSRNMTEYARVLAAKVLLGAKTEDMDQDGALKYCLSRPIGGHNQVFCDVLYADDTIRILKGHHGSIYVFTRVPN